MTLTRIEIPTVSSRLHDPPDLDAAQHRRAPGQEKRSRSQEPVTIRAAAYLTGSSGPFVRLFTESFTEQ